MNDTVLSRSSITPQLSDEQAERSRKNLTAILTGLSREGQVHVANAIGVHESTVSKLKDENFERLSQILAVTGLKVVPVEMRCYPPDEIEALLVLARKRLGGLESAQQLSWE